MSESAKLTSRETLIAGAALPAIPPSTVRAARPMAAPSDTSVTLQVNGETHRLRLDSRATLLDTALCVDAAPTPGSSRRFSKQRPKRDLVNASVPPRNAYDDHRSNPHVEEGVALPCFHRQHSFSQHSFG
jgi:hypothetical protein